ATRLSDLGHAAGVNLRLKILEPSLLGLTYQPRSRFLFGCEHLLVALHDGFSLDTALDAIGGPDRRPLFIDPALKRGLIFCSQQHGCLRRRGHSTPLRLYQFPSALPAISADGRRTPPAFAGLRFKGI